MTRLRLSGNIVIKAARFAAKLNRATSVTVIDWACKLSDQRLRTIATSPLDQARDCLRHGLESRLTK